MTSEPVVVGTIYVPHIDRNLDVVDTFGRIDMDDLSGEISRTGGEAVFWGHCGADAKARAKGADHRANVIRVQAAQRLRKQARELGEKITEAGIEEQTTLDPEVMRAEEEAIEAERVAGLIQSAVYAIVQKSRTLQELAGIVRDERAALRHAPEPPTIPREEPPPAPARRSTKKPVKKLRR